MIHLDDRLANLGDAARLLIGGGGDFSHDVAHVGDRADDLFHGVAGAFHQFGAGFHPADRLGDQPFDLLGRLGAAARQAAHFAGDHREAASLFAGARRFHRGVERQDVGLEGNTVDQGGNFSDTLRTAGDIAHGADHVLHQLAALLRGLRSVGGQLIGVMGIVGVLFHRGGQLFHAGRGFFNRRRLLFGAGGEIGVAGGDFRGGGGDLADPHLDLLNHGAQILAHRRHRVQQLPQLIAAGAGLRLAQIAAGDAFRHRQRAVQRTGDLQRDTPGDKYPGDDGDQGGDAHLQLRQVDVAARLRQFVLHKGVHQRADLMRAFAELPADLLFVLIGRQVGRDAVFVIVQGGQQRLQLRALRVADPAAQGVGRVARVVDGRHQRRFGFLVQAQQQTARAVAHLGQLLVQLNEGQLQIAVGELALHLAQAGLHFRHVPALAHRVFRRDRLLKDFLLLLIFPNQRHQTLQILAALGVPVQRLALVYQFDGVIDIGAIVLQILRLVGLAVHGAVVFGLVDLLVQPVAEVDAIGAGFDDVQVLRPGAGDDDRQQQQ